MRKAVLILFAMLCASSLYSQTDVYVNVKGKETTTCVPMATGVDIRDGKMIVLGQKERSFAVDSVERVSLTDNGYRFLNIAPPSLMANYKFDIPWLMDLKGVKTVNEPVATDPESDSYSDFVENSQFPKVLKINFENGGKAVHLDGEIPGVEITADGAHVIVNSSVNDVEYVLSGESDNGSFKLYSAGKAKITLNGLNLTSQRGAAINIQSKKRMFIVLQDDTENALSDCPDYQKLPNEDEKGCIFSEGQLCFSGNGILKVRGWHKHGIASDQYIRISNGRFQIETSAVKGAGIKSKDGFIMGGGYAQVFAAGDAAKAVSSDSIITFYNGELNAFTSGGVLYEEAEDDYSSCCAMKCDGEMKILGGTLGMMSTGTAGKGISTAGNLYVGAQGGQTPPVIKVRTCGLRIPEMKESNDIVGPSSSPKGIKAMKNIVIDNGTILVNTIGGDGGEGIESKGTTTINGGTLRCFCIDDILNANGGLTFNDGVLTGASLTNDGLDVIWLYCNGGYSYVIGGSGDQTAFDTDGKTFYNRGGTHLGIGGMLCGNTDYRSSNYSVNATIKGNYKYLYLCDDNGNIPVAMQIPENYPANKKGFNYGMLMLSPNIQADTHYRLFGANILVSGEERDGQILNGIFAETTLLNEFTTTSKNTLLNK